MKLFCFSGGNLTNTNIGRILEEAVKAFKNGMHEKALNLLKEALDVAPDSLNVIMNLANLEHQLGHLEEARKYAKRYLKKCENWEMYDILSDYYYSLGKHTEALKYINKALALGYAK